MSHHGLSQGEYCVPCPLENYTPAQDTAAGLDVPTDQKPETWTATLRDNQRRYLVSGAVQRAVQDAVWQKSTNTLEQTLAKLHDNEPHSAAFRRLSSSLDCAHMILNGECQLYAAARRGSRKGQIIPNLSLVRNDTPEIE